MDIRLVEVASPDVITLDWLQQPSGLLAETGELSTAVTVALCSDAVAAVSDVLPNPNSRDRRGWWGDEDAAMIWGGWPLGSKLWLLTRAKILQAGAREGATVPKVIAYINAAMQPFVSAGICSSYRTTATQVDERQIVAHVKIYRGPKSSIALQYQFVWQELFPASPIL